MSDSLPVSKAVHHPEIAILRRGAPMFELDRCAHPCPRKIRELDMFETLDNDLVRGLAFLLIDRADSVADEDATRLAQACSPLPLVGVLPEVDDSEVDRLTTAGFTLVFPVDALTPDFLHALAIGCARTSSNLGKVAEAMAREAVVRDRQRTARDLHDQVIQQLFSLGMDIERLLSPRPELRSEADVLAERLDQAIDDLRHAVGTLRAGTTPLVAQRLQRLVDDARELSGRVVNYAMVGDVEVLDNETQSTLVAVLREALANAVKHGAGPIHASIEITESVVLGVRSGTTQTAVDRAGPDETLVTETQSGNSGMGLGNLANRAVARGGQSELLSMTDGTTLLRWSVPLSSVRDNYGGYKAA